MGLVGCVVARLEGGGAGGNRFVPCDLIATSGGWTPSLHLHSHAGGKAEWSDAIAAFVPGAVRAGVANIGAARRRFALSDCLADGFAAGAQDRMNVGGGTAGYVRDNAGGAV